MSLHQFLAILRARFWLGALVFSVTVGAAVAAALLMPKMYTATAAMIIDTSKPDPLTGAGNGGPPSPALLATQIGVLRSEKVALDVVRSLKLAARPGLREKWQADTRGRGDIDNWLAQALLKAVVVAPARDSNVVNIEFEANDPVYAAQVANAFATSYLNVSLKLRVDPAQRYTSFFESQAKELRANVERAQERLSTFQREKGVVVTDDKLDTEMSRVNELSARLAQQGVREQLPDDLNHPALAGLRGDLGRAEAQLQDYSARWGDNHPQVQQAKATVATLRDRLDTEARRVSGNVGAVNNQQRQQQAELRSSLEAQRARVLHLKSVREEGLVLWRDVENARRAYDNVVGRLSQSTLESHATQGNAFILNEATAPLNPSSPRNMVNVGLAAVVGLVLALGAVVLLEMADPRLRTSDAAFAMLGQPVLGVLPKPGVKGNFAARRVPLVAPLGLGRLAAPKGR